jgi:DNA-binding transcriptional ArsR family regulator
VPLVNIGELEVRVDASPVYELLLQLLLFTRFAEFDPVNPVRSWVARRRLACTPRMLRAMQRLGGRFALWDQLLGLAAEAPASHRVDDFLQRIEEADRVELLLHLIGFYARPFPDSTRDAIRAAATGNRTARRPAVEALAGDDAEQQRAVTALLSSSASETRDQLLHAIGGWYERIFAKDESAVTAQLDADAEARQALLATAAERLILIATGIRYAPPAWIDSVLLIPSLVMRPSVVAFDYKRVRVYGYPVLDEPGSRDLAASGLVRMYEALGNETRLRIVKALAKDSLTVDEVSRRVEEPAAIVRAHLAVLRAGRVVEINCGERTTYQVSDDLMHAVGQRLKSYLRVPP